MGKVGGVRSTAGITAPPQRFASLCLFQLSVRAELQVLFPLIRLQHKQQQHLSAQPARPRGSHTASWPAQKHSGSTFRSASPAAVYVQAAGSSCIQLFPYIRVTRRPLTGLFISAWFVLPPHNNRNNPSVNSWIKVTQNHQSDYKLNSNIHLLEKNLFLWCKQVQIIKTHNSFYLVYWETWTFTWKYKSVTLRKT